MGGGKRGGGKSKRGISFNEINRSVMTLFFSINTRSITMSNIQQLQIKQDIDSLVLWMKEVTDQPRLQTLEQKLKYLTKLLESS